MAQMKSIFSLEIYEYSLVDPDSRGVPSISVAGNISFPSAEVDAVLLMTEEDLPSFSLAEAVAF